MLRTEIINHLGKPITVVHTEGVWLDALDALQQKRPMSFTRMSDGEEKIYQYCKTHPATAPMLQFEKEWRIRYGVEGITCGEQKKRLDLAAKYSTHFAPDGGEEFFLKHWPLRQPYAEIYFPHRMTREMRIQLLKVAGAVTVVNRDPKVAGRLLDSPYMPKDVDVCWISLRDWQESETASRRAQELCAPLVLVSAGPASKHIVPEIAIGGNKVVLDMGSGAPHFWCIRGNPECGDPKCRAVTKEK